METAHCRQVTYSVKGIHEEVVMTCTDRNHKLSNTQEQEYRKVAGSLLVDYGRWSTIWNNGIAATPRAFQEPGMASPAIDHANTAWK